jgi:threonine aldolase
MGAEAVIVMNPSDTVNTRYLRKQQMQLSSKMRLLAAQFLALLEDDLWLKNASHANTLASRLAAGVALIPGVEVVYPVEADAVFARLPPRQIAELRQEWTFHVWDEGTSTVRWMTSFDMQEKDIDTFLASIRTAARTSA